MAKDAGLVRGALTRQPHGRLAKQRIENLGAQMPDAVWRQPHASGGSAHETGLLQQGFQSLQLL